jgi:predicted carbohydrate-binding protein with CBM5 and CBM33 domain
VIGTRLKPRCVIRMLALVLALAGLVGVSAASASPAHGHIGAPNSGCSICFVAHLSAIEPVISHAICALEFRGRAALPLCDSSYAPVFRKTSLSRGPPYRRSIDPCFPVEV